MTNGLNNRHNPDATKSLIEYNEQLIIHIINCLYLAVLNVTLIYKNNLHA